MVVINDEVNWINPCTTVHSDRHMHVSAYLISQPAGNILIDTGSNVHSDIIKQEISRLVGDEKIDLVLFTHQDLPHAGNIQMFQDAELMLGCSVIRMQGFPERTQNMTKYLNGDRGSFQKYGRKFDIIDPSLADRSNTYWLYDWKSGCLFTADSFGYHHTTSECDSLLSEFDYTIEDIAEFHKVSLPWVSLARPELIRAALDQLFSEYDVSFVAPSHGPPIPRNEINDYLDSFQSALTHIVGD